MIEETSTCPELCKQLLEKHIEEKVHSRDHLQEKTFV